MARSLSWVLVMAVAQGVLTRVLIPWFGGERQAALAGMAAAVLAYLGYAFATHGWMMYAVSAHDRRVRAHLSGDECTRFATHSRQRAGRTAGRRRQLVRSEFDPGPAAHDAVFGYFSAPAARVHFPGAAFVAAAALTVACAALFAKSMTLVVPTAPGPQEPSVGSASRVAQHGRGGGAGGLLDEITRVKESD